MRVTRSIGRISVEGGERGVGLGRNNEVAVLVQKGGRKGEFSGWVGLDENETLVRWYRAPVFGPGRR